MKPGIYRCTKDYQSPYPNSIKFRIGEEVLIGEEYEGDPDWRDWIRCHADDREAWIPKSYLWIDGSIAKLLQDYDARELTVNKDDVLKIDKIVNGFGMAEERDGKCGWVPMNHLVPYSPE